MCPTAYICFHQSKIAKWRVKGRFPEKSSCSSYSTCFVGHVYNLKKQFTNYWHYGGNRLLLLAKHILMKSGQKIGQGLPPPPPRTSFGQNLKEQLLFSGNLPLDGYDYWSTCGANKAKRGNFINDLKWNVVVLPCDQHSVLKLGRSGESFQLSFWS